MEKRRIRPNTRALPGTPIAPWRSQEVAMRIARIVTLLLSIGAPDGSRVVARLLDSPHAAVRAAAAHALDAEGLAAAPLLERLEREVTTPEARALLGNLFTARRGDLRALPPQELLAWAGRLAPAMQWRLGLGRTGMGRPVLYFDAATLPARVGGVERLAALEYLVCVEAPREGLQGKGYESLASMKAEEWQALRARLGPKARLHLRWRGEELREVALLDALPWARPSPNESGLKIGGNHDERANTLLPPHETSLQVGVEVD
ncbi:MAG: hypothetical protein ACT4PV_11765 [Planctomycetaceae bacterium]